MALSNIFREPRREIIEQAFGTLAVIAWVGGAYGIALWLGSGTGREIVIGMLLMAAVILVGAFLLGAIHAAGEGICAGLAKLGADPRPRQRY